MKQVMDGFNCSSPSSMEARKRVSTPMMNANDPYNQYNQYNQPYANYPGTSPQYRLRFRSRRGCLIGCLVTILVVAAVVAVSSYFSNTPLSNTPPVVKAVLIASAVPVALIVFAWYFIRSRRWGHGFSFSVVGALCTLAFLGALIALFIYGNAMNFPEVDMTRAAFTPNDVNASMNAQVRFVNPANGVEQILCVGSNGTCAPTGSDPGELDGQGLLIEPGQTITVVFPNSGDFPITSRTTPGMNMTIHVQDNSDDGGD